MGLSSVLGGLFGGKAYKALKKDSSSSSSSSVPVPSPPAIPEFGGEPLDLMRKRRRSGRAQTILTGDLAPMDIGKKTLLG